MQQKQLKVKHGTQPYVQGRRGKNQRRASKEKREGWSVSSVARKKVQR